MTVEFVGFEKIARFSNTVVITEKIDGTNAQIYIEPSTAMSDVPNVTRTVQTGPDVFHIYAGSRNRWIKPGDDNFGFAKWVYENSSELVKLGPGRHFGEWWGAGIQRRYGLTEKRFSLFNTGRWIHQELPACVKVVPLLYSGPLKASTVDDVMVSLSATGSVAAPGFMNPEGVVIYHTASRTLYKKTFDNDTGKWTEAKAA